MIPLEQKKTTTRQRDIYPSLTIGDLKHNGSIHDKSISNVTHVGNLNSYKFR